MLASADAMSETKALIDRINAEARRQLPQSNAKAMLTKILGGLSG